MKKQPQRSRRFRSRARSVVCCAGLVAGTMLGAGPAAATAGGPAHRIAPHHNRGTGGAAAQPASPLPKSRRSGARRPARHS